MPILEAQVATERASRYLVQFCKHAAAMGGGGHTPRMHLHGTMARREVQVAAEWSDTRGTVTFTPWGQCTLTAEASSLTVRVEAVDEDGLDQIRDVITRDFERFSRRNPLTVTWHQPETPDAPPEGEAGGMTSTHRRGALYGNLQTILLVVAVVLVIALHLGLVGTIVANSRWTGMATNVVLALIALKVVLVALVRRRRTTKTPDEM
jgi:hypothetical protein